MLGWAGTAALVVAAGLALLRVVGPGGPELFVGLTAAAPHGALAAGLAVICWLLVAVRTRRWRDMAALAASGLVLLPLASWQAQLFIGDVPDTEPNLVVTAVNCRVGQCDLEQVSDLARHEDVDVLVLSELTPEAAMRWERTDAAGLLPHRFGRPAPGVSGTVTYSRWPLGGGEVIPMDSGMHVVEVRGEHPFTMVAVHTGQPLQGAGRWRGHLEQVRQVLDRIDGPVVSAGDFNASLDHVQMRAAVGSLRDAAEQANSGWQPTWQPEPGALPVFSPRIPLLTLDHVLVGGGVQAVDTEVVPVTGTDHLALIARLAMP